VIPFTFDQDFFTPSPTPYIFGRSIFGFIFFIDGKAKVGKNEAFRAANGVEGEGKRRDLFGLIDFSQLLIMVGM
jgi:hypothetical protein